MRNLIPLLLLLFIGCDQSVQTDNLNIPDNANDVNPLLVGMQIPEIELKDTKNKTVSLADEIRKKPTAIIYYRGGWCPFCNKQLAGLREIEDELYDLGIKVLAISPDSPGFLSETLAEHEISYHLLSDQRMEGAKKLGIAFRVDQETADRYKENGLDLAERSGYNHLLLPVPSVFLVDTDGTIHFQYVNPDYKVRISGNLLLAAAEDLMKNQVASSM
jgi:peroxiredoxin